MAKYNGHKNWNYWNVSLWISNDESLYRMAREARRLFGAKEAPAFMLCNLKADGVTQTPDGAKYTISTLRAAMVGL